MAQSRKVITLDEDVDDETNDEDVELEDYKNLNDIITDDDDKKVPIIDNTCVKGKIITFFTEKGGVTKTTNCVMTALLLQRAGLKVILIDADPQCNSSQMICSPAILKRMDFLKFSHFMIKTEVDITTKTFDQSSIDIFEFKTIHIIMGDQLTPKQDNQINNELESDMSENVKRMDKKMRDLLYLYDVVLVDMNPSYSPVNRLLFRSTDILLNFMTCDNFCLSAIPKLLKYKNEQKLPFIVCPIPALVKLTSKRGKNDKIPQAQFSQYISKVISVIKLHSGDMRFLGYVNKVDDMKSTTKNITDLEYYLSSGTSSKHNQLRRYIHQLKKVLNNLNTPTIGDEFEEVVRWVKVDEGYRTKRDDDGVQLELLLYVVECEDYFKIGFSKTTSRATKVNVSAVVKKISYYCGDVEYVKDVESKLKRWFKPYKKMGEFFEYTDVTEGVIGLLGDPEFICDLILEM